MYEDNYKQELEEMANECVRQAMLNRKHELQAMVYGLTMQELRSHTDELEGMANECVRQAMLRHTVELEEMVYAISRKQHAHTDELDELEETVNAVRQELRDHIRAHKGQG